MSSNTPANSLKEIKAMSRQILAALEYLEEVTGEESKDAGRETVRKFSKLIIDKTRSLELEFDRLSERLANAERNLFSVSDFEGAGDIPDAEL